MHLRLRSDRFLIPDIRLGHDPGEISGQNGDAAVPLASRGLSFAEIRGAGDCR